MTFRLPRINLIGGLFIL